ncbi:DUF721 domain-containing protein [Desulfonatronovibrio hydrogenovorans]|uniref:DUF721 domain-containing protein n=1 Tax=Desulfonatronovibrio hydrogenovorans TaxID=53245 RepID=UPI000689EA7D|nr:DUF721 domain-containing protein [Desulfonatronovibrio hydrogenovorans]
MHKALGTWLDRLDPDGSRYLFTGICRSWEKIVGPEAASLVKPIGRKDRTLILGAQDSIVIQEITFQSDHIVQLVNSFCGSDFFDKVRVELLKGRTPLDRKLISRPEGALQVRTPQRLGSLGEKMDPESPVARCYARYVRFFKPEGPDQTEEK